MSILQISSNNPKFSYIIKKNPEAPMQVRTMRQGLIFGWYSSEKNFNIFFRDGDNKISYVQNQDEQFEYLNVSRYNSPLFVLNTITEFFDYNFKKQDTDDVDGYKNTIYINLIEARLTRYIDFFRREFKDITIDYEEVAHKSLRLRITTEKSIHYLINITNLLALFLSFVSKIYMDINDGMVKKYIDCMNRLDTPYFIRYLFKRNLLSRRKLFEKFKENLEDCQHYDINFTFSDNLHQRKMEINNHLSFENPIIDIGCGEGNYVFSLAKKLDDKPYYAIDIDEEKNNLYIHWLNVNEKKLNGETVEAKYICGNFEKWVRRITE